MSDLIFKRYLGVCAVVGEKLNLICSKWLQHNNIISSAVLCDHHEMATIHITVISSHEFESFSTEQRIHLENTLHYCPSTSRDVPIDVFDAGLSHIQKGSNEMWVIAIYSSWIDNIRKMFNLPPKDLHITLAYQRSNLHNISKGFETITLWNDNCKEIFIVVEKIASASLFDQRAKFLIRKFVQLVVDQNDIGLVKLIGQWALRAQEATIAKELGYFLFEQRVFFGLRLLHYSENCDALLEYLEGKLPLPLDNKLGERQYDVLKDINVKSFQSSTIDGPNTHLWKHSCGIISAQKAVVENESDILCFNQLPRNFSWIRFPAIQNKLNHLLSGSAIPTSTEHIAALRSVGICSIFTLHESPLSDNLLASAAIHGIQTHHYCIADRNPPSHEQTLDICRRIGNEINASRGVLVHCQGGVGRTNFAIIAFLMQAFGLSCVDATQLVTANRKVLMADCQISALKHWWAHTVQQRFADTEVDQSMQHNSDNISVYKTPTSSSTTTTATTTTCNYRDIARNLRLPPVILLCGFAASGKTTFSTALVSAHPEYFKRVNKDEMRAKGQIDSALNNAMQSISSGGPYSGSVVIDCCNLTQSKRREWLVACHNSDAWCIFFDFPLEDCKERIRHRDNHPTIPSGSAGITILDSMSKQLQPPQQQQQHGGGGGGGESFSRIIHLRCEDEVADLLHEWTIPFVAPESYHMKEQQLLKFPRTPHLLNLGAATRDDKILSVSDVTKLLSASSLDGKLVFIEEKLDGANMGISIDPATSRIQVQNRSHYVSASYHPQFAPLNRWIDKHSMELWDILEPGRHVLYGEWLYATHSVRYTALPDWFIAYDCYDRAAEQFLCRPALEALLAQTSIAIAPVIHEGAVPNLDFVLSLVDAGSAFNQERREGIVIRVCDQEKVISRAKLVRKDFIAGNERWDRHALSMNALAPQK